MIGGLVAVAVLMFFVVAAARKWVIDPPPPRAVSEPTPQEPYDCDSAHFRTAAALLRPDVETGSHDDLGLPAVQRRAELAWLDSMYTSKSAERAR